MALEHTPVCAFGRPAPDFRLPGIDGREHAFSDIAGERGTLVMFLCVHCPYVQAVQDRIARDARALRDLGIGVAAICSNDAETHPEDGPEGMRRQAEAAGFDFPYLRDADQSVARAYGAVCTPDFFGFDAAAGLQYRGRLDASGAKPAALDARRELYEAMRQVAETGHGPREQTPSMGCSIKWKRGA
jgi:peroxiredoxin